MPISGYVAGGAADALEQVLDRRLKEQIRQQQEKEHADNVAMQRQQIALQQRAQENLELERKEDRNWRQSERDIASGRAAAAEATPGPQTPEAAALMRKDPVTAARLRDMKVIDAKPIAAQSVLPGTVMPEGAGDVGGPTLQTGDKPMPRMIESLAPRAATPTAMGGAVTAGVDKSGPQQYPVLAPTRQQGEEAKMKSDTATYYDELARASGEDAKHAIAARAARVGIKLDPNLINASQAELRQTALQQQLDAEARANRESDRRTARDEENIRTRPKIMTPGQAINTARGMRKEFLTEVSSATKLQNTYNIMQQGLEGVRKGYTNAGSQAVLITFQKMLDEDSVVREAEYARSGEGLALRKRLEGMVEKYTKGGAGVPLDELENFVKLSNQFLNVAKRSAQKKATLYESFATEQGLDADFVTGGVDLTIQNDTGKGGGGASDISTRPGGVSRPVFNPATGQWERK